MRNFSRRTEGHRNHCNDDDSAGSNGRTLLSGSQSVPSISHIYAVLQVTLSFILRISACACGRPLIFVSEKNKNLKNVLIYKQLALYRQHARGVYFPILSVFGLTCEKYVKMESYSKLATRALSVCFVRKIEIVTIFVPLL